MGSGDDPIRAEAVTAAGRLAFALQAFLDSECVDGVDAPDLREALAVYHAATDPIEAEYVAAAVGWAEARTDYEKNSVEWHIAMNARQRFAAAKAAREQTKAGE